MLTGYFMGALGLPVHAAGEGNPDMNQGQWFYNLNALVLGALAVATVAALLALRRRRPWDAALFALSPALLLTATVNWDLLAIGLAAFGLLAWARTGRGLGGLREGSPPGRWSGGLPMVALAGVLLGLGGAAKMWPLFILGPILVLAIRAGRVWAGILPIVTAAVTVVAVNLPVAIPYRENWGRFFELNTTRPIDWGTLWYIGRYLDGKFGDPASHGPFQWLDANIPTLNWVSYALFGLACLGIGLLALLAPRRPRLAQLAFLVVAAFLIFSKVWSQQFVLWLLPLLVLARPKWGAFLAWQVAEVGYFVAFYGELLGTSTGTPGLPGGRVRAGLDPATGHGGGAVRAGRAGDPAPRARRGPQQLRRRPGRRPPRRHLRRSLACPLAIPPRNPHPRPGPRPNPRHLTSPPAQR